ncbi:threonine/serine ThrE exporter family protein [Sanguibacter suarezii]|uniref:threonine/serine ThrE exporter family protein n=1 Tax=Sanguibacter suarezii TaxID=60921 RepID=UPI00082A745F|nr:threonine/serine exporter family protein [Sanguibacter suarezii]
MRLASLIAVLTVVAAFFVGGPLTEAGSEAQTPTPTATQAPSTPAPGTDPPDQQSAPPTPQDPTPTPTATPTPSPAETTQPAPPSETTDAPTTQAPTDPAPTTDAPQQEPTDDPTDEQAPVIQPVPPAATQSSQPAVMWIIALLVLAASGVVLVMLRRRAVSEPDVDGDLADTAVLPTVPTTAPPETPETPETAATATTAPVTAPTTRLPPRPAPPSTSSAAVTFAAIEAVGEAMLDATYSVITIEAALEDIARANSYPATGVVVMPTALFVSTRGAGELYTGALSSGRNKLLLHQVDALDELVRGARAGLLTPDQILDRIHEIRTAPPPFTRAVRIAAYVLLCAGLAVILGASWGSTAIACVLGALVGTVRLSTANVSGQRAPLVTVALAFGVSTAVFLLARAGWDAAILPSLIAPLVILLPGALLTTGIIELAAGQMMSGAGRLMAGFMQLVLLAVGIVAGAALVGIPKLVLSESHQPIGAIAPWIAVAAYGVGVVVHQGGRRASIPWILLVLYVAYGAQVIGEIFFGGVLSALIGAFVMTPVAVVVSRHATGPAAAVSFLPAFWLLVPGALGLVGVASILDGAGDGDGGSTMVTTLSTMVAIALGILAGSAVSTRDRFSGRDVL